MTFDLRLHAIAPGTDTPLGLLPEPLSWSASVVHNNDGALTVKYSELADGGDLVARGLNTGLDIALEVNHSGTWIEPDNCRFLMVDKDYDRTDTAKVHDLTLPSWSWLLNKVCDLNLTALAGSKSKQAGMRVFGATSDAGDVVKKMLDEHDARSGPAVPIVRSSWSTTLDSGGNAWAKKLGKNADGRAFPAGQPLHEKLDALVKNGLCDYRTRGRGLRIYNPNSNSADLSATVRLRYGDDLTDAPSKVSQADRVARVLVKGDGKHKATEIDPAVPEFYGRWEAMIDSSGVKDDDDLEDAGKAELADRNRIKGEYTRTLTMAGKFLPFRDYNVGDWVKAPGADGDEKLRVMQITITRDEQNGLGGNIVLGDRFTSKDLALAGRVSAITAGTTGVIGNGTVGGTPPQDNRQPSAPTGLAIADTVAPDPFGTPKVTIVATWSPVTTATDGTELDISKYELLGQQQTTPVSEWRTIATTAGNDTEVPRGGFDVGSSWVFTVRAYGETTTQLGAQSAPVSITLGTDTVAPNGPSTPTATICLGSVVVGWSGKDHFGAAMPPDFKRCEVHVSTVSGFTPDLTATSTTRKSAFPWASGGTVTLSGFTYGTPYYVKLVAFDLSENASAPSAQATFTPARAVSNDMAQSAIDAIRDYTVDEVRTTLGGRVTMSTSTPPAVYDGAVNDKWERYSAGALVAVSQWNGFTWDARTISPTYVPQIDIGTGTFGQMAGSRLEANSVVAAKLAITDFHNYAGDGTFQYHDAGVSRSWVGTGQVIDDQPNYARLIAASPGGAQYFSTALFDTTAGTEYYAEFESYCYPVTPRGTTYLMLITYDAAGAQVGTPAISVSAAEHLASGNWIKKTGTLLIPAGSVQAKVTLAIVSGAGIANTAIFRNVKVFKRNSGELIVDGAVTANKMSATDIFAINQVWGLETGVHLSAKPDEGLRAHAPNPDAGGAIDDWLRLGDSTSGDGMSIGFDPLEPLARVTSKGHSSWQSVITEALQVSGLTLDEILDPLPKGIGPWTSGATPVTGITTTEMPLIELRAELEPDRSHVINIPALSIRSSVAGDVYEVRLRVAYDGATVDNSSPIIRNGRFTALVAGVHTLTPSMAFAMNTNGWGASREVRLRLSCVRHSGTGTVDIYADSTQPIMLSIVDQGAYRAPTTTQIRRTSTWDCSAMSKQGSTTALTTATLNSGEFAHCLFNGNAVQGETGLTVAGALSGATLIKAEVGMYMSWIEPDPGYGAPYLSFRGQTNTTPATSLTSYPSTDSAEYYPPDFKWTDVTQYFSTASRSVSAESYAGPPIKVLNTTAHRVHLRLTYLR